MSGLVNVEERETMVGELENLTKEWKERKATSMEMRRASDNLSLHRIGVGDASLRMHRLHDVLQFLETSLKNRIVKN